MSGDDTYTDDTVDITQGLQAMGRGRGGGVDDGIGVFFLGSVEEMLDVDTLRCKGSGDLTDDIYPAELKESFKRGFSGNEEP